MIEMLHPIYMEECGEAAAKVWTLAQRMLAPYLELRIEPAADCADSDLTLPGRVEGIDEALQLLADALSHRAAQDEDEDLGEFADVLIQSVQVALDELENDDDFVPGVNACLNQVYGGDFVTVVSEDGEELRYEILYRTELDGDDFGVLYPLDGESDGNLLILKMIYDDEAEEIRFEDADEETAAIVFTEFREVFAEDFSADEEE